MKLISMTDFVLFKNILLANKEITHNECGLRILKYANFLKQPLKLEMFVPCDYNDNVLEEPANYEVWEEIYLKDKNSINGFKEHESYSEAKEKVLFYGFVYTDSQKYSCLNRIPLSVSPYGLKNERLKLTKLKEDNKYHTWLQLYTIEDLVQCNLELTENALKQIGI